MEALTHLWRTLTVDPPHELGLGRLEAALDQAVAALAVETKIRDAVRAGRLDKAPGDILLDRAVEEGIITLDEHQQVLDADELRTEVIQVAAFDPETFGAPPGSGLSGTQARAGRSETTADG